MSEPAMAPSIELADTSPTEHARFTAFCHALRGYLRERRGLYQGEIRTLASYLDARRAGGLPGGDEQDVVDRLVLDLLAALGFERPDIAYNRGAEAPGGRAIPDFTLRLSDVAGSPPMLIIESKASNVVDFTRKIHRAGRAESPVDQLRRYVQSGIISGRVGLLCNGWRLQAWLFGGEGDALILDVDLYALAHQAEALPAAEFPSAPHRSGLMALWQRCSRAAYADAEGLLKRASRAPRLPPEWITQVQSRLDVGDVEGIRTTVARYHEEVWRARAIDVRGATDRLVDALRGLIERFAEDVRHQLVGQLTRHAGLEADRERIEQEAGVPRQREELALAHSAFDLGFDEYSRIFLSPLDQWCRQPSGPDVAGRVERWMSLLEPHVRVRRDGDAEQLALVGDAPAPGRARSRVAEQRKRVIEGLRRSTLAICRSAFERHVRLNELLEEHRGSEPCVRAFETWARRVSSSVMVGADEETLRTEFARQTAYVYLVRLLVVRICEDKGLFARKLSDGGLVEWQSTAERYLDYAAGRSYEYLTRMAYDCARNVYQHFFGAFAVFDWYRMDEKMLLRAILVLDCFDMAHIDTDIIGTVYGRFLEEGKHEQGRYYTPQPLVEGMLDQLGYRGGEAITGRRIIDLACGSGSFLVAACRRIIDCHRGPDGRIADANLPAVLDEVQGALYGIDINPFACYLAETNLLIQVLDLVHQAQQAGLMLTVDRFRIICDDALMVDETLAVDREGELPFAPRTDHDVAKLIKARVGPYADGFDFVVGNPPYVRADEPSDDYQAYRRRIEEQRWFETRHLKWDLYVPFVEQYLRLCAHGAHARGCLITIESLGTAPYAELLRARLAERATLHDIVFTEGVKLFADAAWQDNIIFSFSARPSDPGHRVRRGKAAELDGDGRLVVEALDHEPQEAFEPGRLFNKQPQIALDLSDTVPFGAVFYVSKGMVLNAHEKLSDGAPVEVPAAYDPMSFGEALVEDRGEGGKVVSHRRFGRDELVSESQSAIHTRPTIGSREVLRGGFGPVRWLEYGPHTRVPARVSRGTFSELYDRPKLMFGTFTGVAVDPGEPPGFMTVSDSVRVAVRWDRLDGVHNRALKRARRELAQEGGPADDAARFSEWYVCALALSAPVQGWLVANRRSMKDHIYPNDMKRIPLKRLDPAEQAPFVALARERHALYAALIAREREGFGIGATVTAPVRRLTERYVDEHPACRPLTLFRAYGRGLIEVEPEFLTVDLSRARARGGEVFIGRAVVARPGASVPEPEAVAEWLAQYLSALPGTLAERQQVDRVPGTGDGLLALVHGIADAIAEIEEWQGRIGVIDAELDRMAWDLYRPARG